MRIGGPHLCNLGPHVGVSLSLPPSLFFSLSFFLPLSFFLSLLSLSLSLEPDEHALSVHVCIYLLGGGYMSYEEEDTSLEPDERALSVHVCIYLYRRRMHVI